MLKTVWALWSVHLMTGLALRSTTKITSPLCKNQRQQEQCQPHVHRSCLVLGYLIINDELYQTQMIQIYWISWYFTQPAYSRGLTHWRKHQRSSVPVRVSSVSPGGLSLTGKPHVYLQRSCNTIHTRLRREKCICFSLKPHITNKSGLNHRCALSETWPLTFTGAGQFIFPNLHMRN